MDEYTEGLLVVAVYLLALTAFALPFLVGYLFIRINRAINKAWDVINYIDEQEKETTKYHD